MGMLGLGVLLLGQALGPAGSGVEPAVGRAFELNWQAPAGCPASAEVRLATERLLRSSGAAAVQGGVRATARVRKNRERFELALTLGEGASARTRELHAPACEELVQAAALVIALAVDPSLALAEEGSRAEAIEPASSPCVESRVDAFTTDFVTAAAGGSGARVSGAAGSCSPHGRAECPRLAATLGPGRGYGRGIRCATGCAAARGAERFVCDLVAAR
ncbi:MAG: hypothetical protein QM744_09460 [Mesorhizobium sp.]